jgi:hypothetical protein
MQDWNWNNQQHFGAMSFDDFMTEFRSKWLPKNWESDIHRKILGTKQESAFWGWAVKVHRWNALLHNMANHLDDNQLRNQLEANVEPALAIIIVEEGIAEQDLDKWLSIVKNLDDKKRRD